MPARSSEAGPVIWMVAEETAALAPGQVMDPTAALLVVPVLRA